MWKCKCGNENDDKSDFCNNCGAKKPKYKPTALSIVAFVISLIPCLGALGFILGIIDLVKNKAKNKVFSIIACVIGGFYLLLILLYAVLPKEDSNTVSSNEIEKVEKTESAENETTEIALETTPEPVATEEPTPVPTEEPTEAPTPEPTIDPTIAEKEYKDSCEEYAYKTVMRNPDEYIGKKIKIKLKVSSTHDEMFSHLYYFANSESEYGWYGDMYGVYDYRNDSDESYFKILDDDIIYVYGEIMQPQETVSLIVNSQEIFCIDMKYAELIEE